MIIENYEINQVDDMDRKIRNVKFRNPPQVIVLKMLGVNNDTDMDKIRDLGTQISAIIDDPNQVQIRNLIVDKNFNEAAKLIHEVLMSKNLQSLVG